jgi:hypothetical protein
MSRLWVLLVWVVLLSAQSNIVDQLVENFPILDTAGTHWIIYDVNDPQVRSTDQSDAAALTMMFGTALFWSSDVGLNYPPPVPAPGDELCIIGSWDSAYVNNPTTYGDNPNHTGFYWLFSDTLISFTDNHWLADTLRPLPTASVVTDAEDSIEVSIQNPAETRYPGQTAYDVVGYELWADSTGAGTPNSFDVWIGSFAVQGGAGDYSLFKYYGRDYFPSGDYSIYHAYRFVSRPPFRDDRQSGHMTYFLSQNSNMIDFPGPGVNETHGEKVTFTFYAMPNPCRRQTCISYSLQKTSPVLITVHNVSGQLVSTLVDEVRQAGEHRVVFDGTDMPSGVYFCQLVTPDVLLQDKLTLLR